MDRQAALLEVAPAHAVALRLHDAGASDDAVAEALGIPEAAVGSLIRIAEAKVAALVERGDAVGPAGPTSAIDAVETADAS